MTTQRTFNVLRKNYVTGANNAWVYWKYLRWYKKPFALPLCLLVWAGLMLLSLLFLVLIPLDWLSSLTDGIRTALMQQMQDAQSRAERDFTGFLFSPVIIMLLTPLFVLSVILPKISSQIDMEEYPDFDGAELSGTKTFKTLNGICWGTAKNLVKYATGVPILLKIPVLLIALIASFFLVITGLLVLPLVLLDWITGLVESIRRWFALKTALLADKIRYSLGGLLSGSIALALLAPVVLIVLLIPRFSGAVDLPS